MGETSADWIKREYEMRRAKNPSFSIRSFARFIGLPPGRVSELLSNKRHLTPAIVARIAERLSLSAAEAEVAVVRARNEKKTRKSQPRESSFVVITQNPAKNSHSFTVAASPEKLEKLDQLVARLTSTIDKFFSGQNREDTCELSLTIEVRPTVK